MSGSYSVRRVIPLIAAAALALLTGPLARAQGGPPMITDDPGTPGPNHWEINLSWDAQHTDGATLYGLPFLDANYGVGDRTELTYDTSWGILTQNDEPSRSGLGDSLLGVKYRFYDDGDKGWQASVYPQVTFLTPDSNSDRRGLADGDTTLLLPFEVARDFGNFAINFDLGHIFSNASDTRGWMGGFLIGKDVRKGWELDAEIHFNTDESMGRVETILNAGTRINLSDTLILMFALGTDLTNTLSPKVGLLSYVGLQLQL